MSWFHRFSAKKDRTSPESESREQQQAPDGDGVEFLLTAADAIELGVIESKLRAYEIPVFKKFREAGDYLNVIMGSSIFGVDLYVPSKYFEQAKELLEDESLADEFDSGRDAPDADD